jgi:hypothetical protein
VHLAGHLVPPKSLLSLAGLCDRELRGPGCSIGRCSLAHIWLKRNEVARLRLLGLLRQRLNAEFRDLRIDLGQLALPEGSIAAMG